MDHNPTSHIENLILMIGFVANSLFSAWRERRKAQSDEVLEATRERIRLQERQSDEQDRRAMAKDLRDAQKTAVRNFEIIGQLYRDIIPRLNNIHQDLRTNTEQTNKAVQVGIQSIEASEKALEVGNNFNAKLAAVLPTLPTGDDLPQEESTT